MHAIYLEADKKIERNAIEPRHFSAWKDWAKANHHGIDFNPTCFSHPLSVGGFTLSHRDPAIRQFWVEHCIASRKIGEYFGKELGTPAVTNIWIPDGFKDTPADRSTPRSLLLESLDRIFAEKLTHNLDSVEPKLFGIGSESYVTGSMEFYTAYAVSRKILLTLDSGHFHPTESIADKISSMLIYLDEILLHVSRGVRWDSDHVVTFNDDRLGAAGRAGGADLQRQRDGELRDRRLEVRRDGMPMPQKVKLIAGSVTVTAELSDTDCAKAIAGKLPIEAVPNEWGDEFYFAIPVKLPLDATATGKIKIGDIGYWPPGSALAIFFGRTPMSTGPDPVPASEVNLVGRITSDALILKKAKGGASIRIEKE